MVPRLDGRIVLVDLSSLISMSLKSIVICRYGVISDSVIADMTLNTPVGVSQGYSRWLAWPLFTSGFSAAEGKGCFNEHFWSTEISSRKHVLLKDNCISSSTIMYPFLSPPLTQRMTHVTIKKWEFEVKYDGSNLRSTFSMACVSVINLLRKWSPPLPRERNVPCG